MKVRTAIRSPSQRLFSEIGYFPVVRAETKAMTRNVIARVKITLVRLESVCAFRSESIECFIEILFCSGKVFFGYNLRVKDGSNIVAS